MDSANHKIIAGEYNVKEGSVDQVYNFLKPLKEAGLNPISCTNDGNLQAIMAIKKIWSDIVIQRCVVHVQRQGLMWCRRFPKRTDSKRLRELFLRVVSINSQEQCTDFLIKLYLWEKKYGAAIGKSKERGRVSSDIKRARSMLIKAIPNMFHYLENNNIPKSTNGLEGYFSRLKGRYRQHRGLSKTKRYKYFCWYFNVCKR